MCILGIDALVNKKTKVSGGFVNIDEKLGRDDQCLNPKF